MATTTTRKRVFRFMPESIADQSIVQKGSAPWSERVTGKQAVPCSLIPVPCHSTFPLKFPAFWPMLRMQTNLSARIAVTAPAGGEMSGLMAHFLFAENFPVFRGIFLDFLRETGQTPQLAGV
jgi:hypothetical protein